jgi:hypothetical protein
MSDIGLSLAFCELLNAIGLRADGTAVGSEQVRYRTNFSPTSDINVRSMGSV